MILGIVKLFLIVGCFRLAAESEEWTPSAVLYGVGALLLFWLDGEYQIDDFAQLAVTILLAAGLFYLLGRLEGMAWFLVVVLGILALMLL